MSDGNPYQAPRAPMLEARGPTPGVWTGYVIYCVFMALIYLGVAAAGVVLAALPLAERGELDGMDPFFAGLILVLGIVFFIPYAAAPFLGKKPWTWVLGIALIGIGLTSCLTLPFCVPLLLYWLKPETQRYFGKTPEKLT